MSLFQNAMGAKARDLGWELGGERCLPAVPTRREDGHDNEAPGFTTRRPADF
jgi:hypothetical protein